MMLNSESQFSWIMNSIWEDICAVMIVSFPLKRNPPPKKNKQKQTQNNNNILLRPIIPFSEIMTLYWNTPRHPINTSLCIREHYNRGYHRRQLWWHQSEIGWDQLAMLKHELRCSAMENMAPRQLLSRSTELSISINQRSEQPFLRNWYCRRRWRHRQ